MKTAASVCLLAAVILVTGASPVQATKIVHMNPQKLAETASDVVRGTVIGSESYWNASGSKIFTETIITVDESYKGSAGGEVRVLQVGGVVDGVQVTVHGALQWVQGEEVVVFLESDRSGKYLVSGFSQGKFQVQRDPVTGRAFVQRPDLEDVELVNDDGSGHADATSVARVPLDQFLSKALGAEYAPSNR
jgi:hypothetical protein